MTDLRSAEDADVFDPAELRHIRADPAALERFYLAHYEDVVRYLARRVHDPYDVADLVADTFVAAVDGAHTFDAKRGRPLPWLIGIAHNKLRRFHRQRDTNRRAVERAVGRRLVDEDDIAELEERIDAERQAAKAVSSFRRLSEGQRELIDLADIQGFSPAEIAAVLGIPAGVARLRLHRARKALRKAFQEQGETA